MDRDDIDEALEETFPASDPPANTVETGIGAPADEDGDEGKQPPPPLPPSTRTS
jgi:hypothetical protein